LRKRKERRTVEDSEEEAENSSMKEILGRCERRETQLKATTGSWLEEVRRGGGRLLNLLEERKLWLWRKLKRRRSENISDERKGHL